ncbi:MAG: riboflavin synthase [Planctomycetota bacterium]
MFTGLISHCLPCSRVERQGGGMRLALANPWRADRADPIQAGESIAVSGCCLTVATEVDGELIFDLSAETLARTWFGELEAGRPLNLERSVKLADRLGGHLVSAHVDATGELLSLADSKDGGRVLRFRAPPAVERYLIDKGSVAIDGISLTVIAPQRGEFDVAVIPTTLTATSLGFACPGQRLNLEADQVGKWIEKLLGSR